MAETLPLECSDCFWWREGGVGPILHTTLPIGPEGVVNTSGQASSHHESLLYTFTLWLLCGIGNPFSCIGKVDTRDNIVIRCLPYFPHQEIAKEIVTG